MKNSLSTFFFLLVSLIAFTGCSLEEVSPPTTMEFTVTNSLGNQVSGATIKLYTSQVDLENETNQFGSAQTTDANGKAKFKDLQAMKYFWSVEKGCLNNANGAVTTQSPIEANKNTPITSILSETGNLNLINNSSNPYKVYVNGVLGGTAAGKSSYLIPDFPVGSYAVKVVQESGYIFEPTVKEYTVSITCGQTVSVVFP